MAKVKIRKGNSVIEVELKEGWTEEDIKLLLSTGVAEEVVEKPKKKKKMSDKHRTTEYYKNVEHKDGETEDDRESL